MSTTNPRLPDVQAAMGSLTLIAASSGNPMTFAALLAWTVAFAGHLVEWGVVTPDEMLAVMESLHAEAESSLAKDAPLTGADLARMGV